MTILLSPYQLTPKLKLKNRIIMAPMTRRRAAPDYTPGQQMIEYYAKRAEAGLIVTEGTLISEDAIGYGNVPGIFKQKHIDQWSKITEAVHKQDGLIFMQLWHCGRVSHPYFHNNKLPISASATLMNSALGHSGYQCGMARAATTSEIFALIEEFAIAAQNAIKANFDGIEIHGANGYLVDQFLHYCTNQRNDQYGDTPANMARFCLEVISACGNAIGYDKIGLRLSPLGHMNEMVTEVRDKAVYCYLLKELEKYNIAYVHTGIFDDTVSHAVLDNNRATGFLRSLYNKTLIASGNYDFNAASIGISQGLFDLIAIGRPFIANPDLIECMKNNIAIKTYHPDMLAEL